MPSVDRDSNPTLQGFHGKLEPEAILAEAVLFGHLDVLEHQRVRVGAANAELVFLA